MNLTPFQPTTSHATAPRPAGLSASSPAVDGPTPSAVGGGVPSPSEPPPPTLPARPCAGSGVRRIVDPSATTLTAPTIPHLTLDHDIDVTPGCLIPVSINLACKGLRAALTRLHNGAQPAWSIRRCDYVDGFEARAPSPWGQVELVAFGDTPDSAMDALRSVVRMVELANKAVSP